jgi:hypothetical protein
MTRRIYWIIGLILGLTMATTALAQGPEPQHSDPTWQASYWNNTALSGAPALQRSETSLDHEWGTGSPGPGVNADRFSARWTRYVEFAAGSYRFTVTSDDGVRVWVDGERIVNEWYDHAAKTVSVDKKLDAGHHLMVVEFYENTGWAVARLSWTPTPTTITAWRGEYFDNATLDGAPAVVRDDAQIDFNWSTGSPAPAIGTDRFSARWTRDLSLPVGAYRFTMTVDDGGRLWVNGHLLIDAWREQGATTYTGDIYLPGGAVSIKMEYYENTGLAVARLSWSRTDDPPPQPGTVIVDDTDAGFARGGSATGWHIAAEGFGGRLLWTRNNDRVRDNYNWARWYPGLTAGRYEVLVYVPERYTTTMQARYWVSHADGFALRIVNQSTNGDRWVSLGTYRFGGTRNDYVSLTDVTYESRLTRLIAFDAIKWEPR